ncbi:MAG TPA: UDP-N-acetylmuramate dehydrogenase [Rhodanobacteraceae bacterium]|nr:UDP-N-acetylmuramate dehydrogenase [Rhodanobacteraceae bacterium]
MASEAGNATDSGAGLVADAPLGDRNTLRVAARARHLVELREPGSLPELLARAELRDHPLLVLGSGSNILFTGDYPGTVLVMAALGVELTVTDAGGVGLRVAAGERWDDFVRWSLAEGHAGLENLIMIPGTVGAAPIQNIGAYGVEVAEFIEAVEAWDREAGRFVSLARDDCAFGYRDSRFKREPGRHIVTAVRFRLPRAPAPRTDYAGLREELARMGVERPAPFHVAEAVVHLRTRKLPDPAVIGNAGSFFKNPIVPLAEAQALKAAHPALALWPLADGAQAKLSAAWLIEACGFKGVREGDAGISNRHALVLVNHGGASGAELWALAGRVRDGVAARFGVTLQPEPVVV